MTPTVSVIIPTYNRSAVLAYAIHSVLRQTFADFELLVVGDGCTDDSEAVARSFGDSRVSWINLPTNSGHQSEPINEGIRHACGEHIAYLNHDDLWLPHHLASVVEALKGGADFAYSMCLVVMPDGTGNRLQPDPAHDKYSAGMSISPINMVHRRTITERIGKWQGHTDIDMAPDTELWLRAYTAGNRLVFVPRLTAVKFPAAARHEVYRNRPSQEQAGWWDRIENEKDFETTELTNILIAMARAAVTLPSKKTYGSLVREVLKATRNRVIGRTSRSENCHRPVLMQPGESVPPV